MPDETPPSTLTPSGPPEDFAEHAENYWFARHSKSIIFLIFVLTVIGVYEAFSIPVAVFPTTNFPRIIIAPVDTADCFQTAVEAFNLAEKYQLPVLIISDLLLSEHPETIEREDLPATVPIDRGELITDWVRGNGKYKRYAFTRSGISPRALPGTADTLYIAATDEHDEEGILISDVFTNAAVRRKIAEKRMKKLDLALRQLPAPQLEGPANAEVTLVGWGSTRGVIREAVQQLAAAGIRTNQLQFKYVYPFHKREALAILQGCKCTICVEVNATGQFARHLRAETGYSVHDHILKYDGEPFEPQEIAQQVQAILAGRPRPLDVTSADAREIAYHYIRTHLDEDVRPGRVEKDGSNGASEPLWRVEIVHRDSNEKRGELRVGIETGSTYSWRVTA